MQPIVLTACLYVAKRAIRDVTSKRRLQKRETESETKIIPVNLGFSRGYAKADEDFIQLGLTLANVYKGGWQANDVSRTSSPWRSKDACAVFLATLTKNTIPCETNRVTAPDSL